MSDLVVREQTCAAAVGRLLRLPQLRHLCSGLLEHRVFRSHLFCSIAVVSAPENTAVRVPPRTQQQLAPAAGS